MEDTNRKGSMLVVLSYILDWIIIIAAAAVGYAFSVITPFKRPFSLFDQDISFPYVEHEKISNATLVVVSLIAPLIIILAICLLLVPGPTISGRAPAKLVWRRKAWELYTGWTGLAMSCAAAFLITDGLKNLFGRPRPDLLSRCQADYANAIHFAAGALAPGNITLRVSQTICQNTDKSIMDDGFRSFPSGHSSFSAAGLLYLSLFLASKMSITIPFLTPQAVARTSRTLRSSNPTANQTINSPNGNINGSNNLRERAPKVPGAALESANYAQPSGHDDVRIAARDQAASPPLYLLVIAVIPSFAAMYIASTRFADFRHHAFDILFGQFIGITTAWFSFRWYHLPIRQGAGWSWGPRSSDRAFWAGVGRGVYINQHERDGFGEMVGKNMATNGSGGLNTGSPIDLEAGTSDGRGSLGGVGDGENVG